MDGMETPLTKDGTLMLTRQFWLGDTGVLVRAIRTAAQTAIAAIGVGTTNLFSADIKNVLALSASAAVLSVLMSLDRNTEPKAVEIIEVTPAGHPPPAASEPAEPYTPVDPSMPAKTPQPIGFYNSPTHGCGESLR